jgi:hypothetical protein
MVEIEKELLLPISNLFADSSQEDLLLTFSNLFANSSQEEQLLFLDVAFSGHITYVMCT